MKTLTLILKHFSLIVVILIIASCEKNDYNDYNDYFNQKNEPALPELKDLTDKNSMIETYALVLASSLGDDRLRHLIKEQAQLMFDGDYNILASTLNQQVLPNTSLQVRDVLELSYKDLYDCNSGEIFFDSLLSVFPNLQVSVPVHCDEWDTYNYIPLVAFVPYDFDEYKNKVTAYNTKGEKHLLCTYGEPEYPVIVVGISERIDEKGNRIGMEPEYLMILPENTLNHSTNLKSGPPLGPASLTISHGVARQIKLQWSDVNNETGYQIWRMLDTQTSYHMIATTEQNNNVFLNNLVPHPSKVWYKVRAINNAGASSWSPIMATTVSARNDGEPLKIKRMKFTTSALNAVESWIRGAPELRVRVLKATPPNQAIIVFTSGRFEPPRRKDINNTWWNNEINALAQWWTNTFGTVLTFDWQEEDNITNVTHTITAMYEAKYANGTLKVGGTTEIQVKHNSIIGNTSVLWWQERNTIYNINGFQWQFVH